MQPIVISIAFHFHVSGPDQTPPGTTPLPSAPTDPAPRDESGSSPTRRSTADQVPPLPFAETTPGQTADAASSLEQRIQAMLKTMPPVHRDLLANEPPMSAQEFDQIQTLAREILQQDSDRRESGKSEAWSHSANLGGSSWQETTHQGPRFKADVESFFRLIREHKPTPHLEPKWCAAFTAVDSLLVELIDTFPALHFTRTEALEARKHLMAIRGYLTGLA